MARTDGKTRILLDFLLLAGVSLGASAAEPERAPLPPEAASRSPAVQAPRPPVKNATGCTRMFNADFGDTAWFSDGCKDEGEGCYRCEVSQGGLIIVCYETPDGESSHCPDEDDPPDPPEDPDTQTPGDSPILIDLDNNGFHLVGLADAVLFDLLATGIPGYYSWTRAHERDAFLCRDLNGNGRIDNGRELFGNATVLADGSRRGNGYEALRELDLRGQGGNEDGRLTAEEPGFRELCVWVDTNHDGLSDPGEVLSLAQAGVVELSYDYHESRRRDAYGNQFRYQSTAKLLNPAGKPHVSSTYDVFFRLRKQSL